MEQALSQQATCAHCGTLFFASSSQSTFCCTGCEFVFGLIRDQGLQRYYEIREANPPPCPIPAKTSSSTYDYCDDVEFIKRTSLDGRRMRFYLEGLNCTACLWLLEKLPEFCPSAASARVNMSDSTIDVKRTGDGRFSEIAQTLNRFGYSPHPLRDSESARELQIRERRSDLIRIGVAAAATGNIMILSVSLYGGADGSIGDWFRALSGVLATPVLTYCAWPFYRNTITAIKTRQFNIDVPIVAALVAGIIASLIGLWRGSVDGEETVYFDSLSMLVFLLLSSRFALKSLQARQRQATNLEDELLLSTVQRIGENGVLESVSSLTLKASDQIVIEGEATIPVDGVILSGSGYIDASVMTGESAPIPVGIGSRIEAGSRAISGDWVLRVEKPPSQTRLAAILRDTEKSAEAKSSFIHFSDRVARHFIGIVFTLAAGLLVWFSGALPFVPADWNEGITRALALVIVTCPCVFGVAIPLSMSFAIRRAARRGLVVKDGDAIERFWGLRTLVFDKTGTLTTGEMAVVDSTFENRFDLGIVYALEKDQLHPVARALVRHLKTFDLPEIEVEDVKPLEGGGIKGKAYGILYRIAPLDAKTPNASSAGISSSYGLFCDDRHGQEKQLASFELSDQPRAEAFEMLAWARENGFKTKLLSGDRAHVVQATAARLGFADGDVIAQASPERKVEEIRKLKNDGIAMIGDGANDAAALAASDLGIAVCGSLDISLRAADVYITRPKLTAIRELYSIATLTKRAIRRNLIFSASFNIVSGTLAITGYMTPLWAAVLMPISSLIVLLSSTYTGEMLERAERTT